MPVRHRFRVGDLFCVHDEDDWLDEEENPKPFLVFYLNGRDTRAEDRQEQNRKNLYLSGSYDDRCVGKRGMVCSVSDQRRPRPDV